MIETVLAWFGAWCATSLTVAVTAAIILTILRKRDTRHPEGAGSSPVSHGSATPAPPPPPGPPPLTAWERDWLNRITARPIPPQGRHNGQEAADRARKLVPHLDDIDLGRVILHAHYWARYVASLMPPPAALAATIDLLGAAAAELTSLERETTP